MSDKSFGSNTSNPPPAGDRADEGATQRTARSTADHTRPPRRRLRRRGSRHHGVVASLLPGPRLTSTAILRLLLGALTFVMKDVRLRERRRGDQHGPVTGQMRIIRSLLVRRVVSGGAENAANTSYLPDWLCSGTRKPRSPRAVQSAPRESHTNPGRISVGWELLTPVPVFSHTTCVM